MKKEYNYQKVNGQKLKRKVAAVCLESLRKQQMKLQNQFLNLLSPKKTSIVLKLKFLPTKTLILIITTLIYLQHQIQNKLNNQYNTKINNLKRLFNKMLHLFKNKVLINHLCMKQKRVARYIKISTNLLMILSKILIFNMNKST